MARLVLNQKLLEQLTQPKVSVLYNEAEYAADVHIGFNSISQKRTPARPFMSVAVAQTPIAELFVENFKATQDLDQAFNQTCEDLHDQMKASIEAPIWKWDKVTVRKNGSIVFSPRDIKDTGHLLNSQKWRRVQ